MIQRVQTIWLLLAAIAGFITTRVTLYSGTFPADIVRHYSVTENLLLFAITILACLLALAAIFLFKNRPLQFKLSLGGVLVSILLIALEVWEFANFKETQGLIKANYEGGGLLPIAMAVFFILAARNIRKDEKLVKSLDRLR